MMPARRPVEVSAPGKLILMGEHAAVYGRPALIAAIDLRLTARLSPLSPEEIGEVRLDLPGLGHEEATTWDALRAYAAAARDRWSRYAEHPGPATFQEVRGKDPAHVVKIALGEAAEALVRDAGLPDRLDGARLRIDSALPIGSGFGSSAATATAVVAAVLSFGTGEEPAPERIARLALEVERRQHGQPSGVDGATVLQGGVLWARRTASGELAVEQVAVRSDLLSRLRVYDTGTPAEPTGAVVAAVRALREGDPGRHERTLDRMEAATQALRSTLEEEAADPDRSLHLIREHEACLEDLGVVPGEIRSLVRRVEGEGGAAKISGAGSLSGPGAGSLLVYHPDPERVARWEFLRPFPFHPVHLGAPGFHREDLG